MKNHIVPVAILILVCAALFCNTLSNSFVWDDEILIADDAHIKRLSEIPFVLTPSYWNRYFPGTKGHYRPIRTITFALDYAVWQLNPFGYHLTNLIFHALNTVLVYLFVCLLAGAKNGSRAGKESTFSWSAVPFLSALFFAAHPIHTESVAWIKNRSDLLASFFTLLSCALFVCYQRSKKRSARPILYTASLFAFLLALSSKEMALALPAILVVYALVFLPKSAYRRFVFEIVPFFLAVVGYLGFKIAALGMIVSSVNRARQLGALEKALAVIKTFGVYGKLLTAPFWLNAERLFSIPRSPVEPAVLLGGAGIIIVSILIGREIFVKNKRSVSSETSRLVLFSIAWVMVSILPASNILFLSRRPIAEQRLYIPSIGFCILLGVLVSRFSVVNLKNSPGRLRAAITILAAGSLFSAYSYTTVRRNLDWKDSATFWTATAAASPESDRANYNLGNTFSKNGNQGGAIPYYDRAIELNPEYAQAYNNLGVAYADVGRVSDAVLSLTKAIELDPNHARAYNNLGNAYGLSGEYPKAVTAYENALKINPDYEEARKNLEAVLAMLTKREKYVNHVEKDLTEAPPDAGKYNDLGLAYHAMGLNLKAIDAYRKAIEIDPKYVKAYCNLGATYGKMGKQERAVTVLKKALEIDPDYADAHNNLAVTYYAMGEYELSVWHCDKAVELGHKVHPKLLELLAPHRGTKDETGRSQ
ncbi:MAG: tetratricopeptide repeat protein [Candidatus Omnitrophota bacterium]